MSARKKSTERKHARVPRFASLAAERAYWAKQDSTRVLDWSVARSVRFAALKPSTETISLRLPASLLQDLKVLANQRDVPYQSLLKVFLAERVADERGRRRPRRPEA